MNDKKIKVKCNHCGEEKIDLQKNIYVCCGQEMERFKIKEVPTIPRIVFKFFTILIYN